MISEMSFHKFYPCDQCDGTFLKVLALKNHMKINHRAASIGKDNTDKSNSTQTGREIENGEVESYLENPCFSSRGNVIV